MSGVVGGSRARPEAVWTLCRAWHVPPSFPGGPKAARVTGAASHCPQASSSPHSVLELEHLDDGGFQTISS